MPPLLVLSLLLDHLMVESGEFSLGLLFFLFVLTPLMIFSSLMVLNTMYRLTTLIILPLA